MITVSLKRFAAFLAFVVVSLALASVAGSFSTYVLGHPRLFGLVKLFNVDAEGNIPTWYASISLLACSALLAVISQIQPKEALPKAFDWQTLSIIFLFLSIDELATIHEMLIGPMRKALGTSGIFHFAWVVPYSVLVLFLGLKYLKFLAQLPARTRHSVILAGTLYVGGALGMEMVNGLYANLYGQQNLTYAFLTTIEETLEMLGIAVFLYTLLAYMRRYAKVIQINMGDRDSALEVLPETVSGRSRSI